MSRAAVRATRDGKLLDTQRTVAVGKRVAPRADPGERYQRTGLLPQVEPRMMSTLGWMIRTGTISNAAI